MPCKYKTQTITSSNISISKITVHGWIGWAAGHGIALNSPTWWVIRTKQACKATNNSRSGWHHLIMAVVLLRAWTVLSQVSLKWCNLINSHLRAMNFNKISSLSFKVSRYLTDSPNSTHTSPRLVNSLESCLPLRSLQLTPCLPNKWCFFSSNNPLLQQQHPHLR